MNRTSLYTKFNFHGIALILILAFQFFGFTADALSSDFNQTNSSLEQTAPIASHTSVSPSSHRSLPHPYFAEVEVEETEEESKDDCEGASRFLTSPIRARSSDHDSKASNKSIQDFNLNKHDQSVPCYLILQVFRL